MRSLVTDEEGLHPVPFSVAAATWRWATAMQLEHEEAKVCLPSAVGHLYDALQAPAPPEGLSRTQLAEAFNGLLRPFKDVKELREALKRMKRGSTSGPLGVSVEHLIYATDEVLEVLIQLTAASFAGINGETADTGEIIPLFKSDSKFRPIVLLEVSHKVVTATVADRFSLLICEHCLVDDCHFGFVKGGGVTVPIRVLTALVEQARVDPNLSIHAALIDLVSAFDNVPHDFLEASLASIGASDQFCHWVRATLKGQRRLVSTAC
jgi:hypothetical protein